MGSSLRRAALALAGAAALAAAASTAPAAEAAPAAQAEPTGAAPGWSIANILSDETYSNLLTLAAVGKHDAWAFGQINSTGKPVAAHWNGSAWTRSRIPGAFIRPGNVSATGPRNVWASGSECSGGPGSQNITAAYVARYNGRAWTTTKWKTGAYCGGALVTTGARNGWLLGYDQALHFTGKRWQKVSVPSLGQVVAATAVSSHDIWTADLRLDAEHLSRSKEFFTHYNGHSWRTVRIPPIKLPKHGFIYPFDIEAAGANSIWATVTVEPAAVHSYLLHWTAGKWHTIALPDTPDQLLQVTPDGAGGAWLIMFQSRTGAYSFVHYSHGTWTVDPVPTAGLAGLIPGSETFDVYALARIPGTQSMLATGDVFYATAKDSSVAKSLIFRYTP
jgi:hypothetical protein